MTRRLKLMLAVLAAVGLLVLLDRPDSADAFEVSEEAPRPARTVAHESAPLPPPQAPLDAPIPDLFAGTAAPVAAAEPEEEAKTQARPPKPFTLLGFRQEGEVREAYLLHGGEVATVRAGDLLEKRYQVLALGGDSLDIKDKQSGTAIRIGFEDHQ